MDFKLGDIGTWALVAIGTIGLLGASITAYSDLASTDRVQASEISTLQVEMGQMREGFSKIDGDLIELRRCIKDKSTCSP